MTEQKTEKTNFFPDDEFKDLETPPNDGEVAVYTYEDARNEVMQTEDAEWRQLLLDMLERNRTAQLLAKIDNDEQRESRQRFLQIVQENFIAKRMRADNIIEDLRLKIAKDLLENAEFLDNETRILALEKLTTSTQADASRAGTSAGLGGDFMPPQTQFVINNNNNSGDGNQVVAPDGIMATSAKLDQINHLNETLRMWATTGAPAKATDAEFHAKDEKDEKDGTNHQDDKPV